jgi:hypothetical protein
MSSHAASGLFGRAGCGAAAGKARRVEVPAAARELSGLSPIDYEDGFLLRTGLAGERSGEQWARACLEDAPAHTRHALRKGWAALGLKLGPTDNDQLVLGWRLAADGPDFALLAAGSRLGLVGEVLVRRERDAVLVATFVQLRSPLARAAWALVAPQHRRVVPHLLEQAGRRFRAEERGPR